MHLGIGVRGKVGDEEEKEDGWKKADDGLMQLVLSAWRPLLCLNIKIALAPKANLAALACGQMPHVPFKPCP